MRTPTSQNLLEINCFTENLIYRRDAIIFIKYNYISTALKIKLINSKSLSFSNKYTPINSPNNEKR